MILHLICYSFLIFLSLVQSKIDFDVNFRLGLRITINNCPIYVYICKYLSYNFYRSFIVIVRVAYQKFIDHVIHKSE